LPPYITSRRFRIDHLLKDSFHKLLKFCRQAVEVTDVLQDNDGAQLTRLDTDFIMPVGQDESRKVVFNRRKKAVAAQMGIILYLISLVM
jgi:hypothetical protein